MANVNVEVEHVDSFTARQAGQGLETLLTALESRIYELELENGALENERRELQYEVSGLERRINDAQNQIAELEAQLGGK